ncbi:MAG: M20/M25/M40 family metallo-hydrolase [Candidatus Acidiferrales bacterium]|jgi:acetylornithine deacetylase/succinyl-diaminopimelate desuccinylase-like protein
MKASILFKLAIAAIIFVSLVQQAPAQSKDNPTAQLLTELIRVDTSNPPGNEEKLADLLAAKFRPLGVEVEIIQTPEPGKAHFIARLKGDGSKKPVLIAAHADVVGVERDKWSVDPFAGEVKDGYVYGRGAIDVKGGLAVFAEALMRLAKNHVPLHRDVILLSEADEEGGKYSTTWLAETHWNLMDCEFALNEGGWIMKDAKGGVQYVSISTADKLSIPLIVTAKGTSTHSSMPRPDSAIFTLSKAMARLAGFETPVELIPSTREFFETLAKTSEPPLSTYLQNLLNSKDPKVVQEADREISKNALLHALMRNTLAPVFLKAGFRGNVIPGSAEATINLRIIPGTDLQKLIAEIRNAIGDPRVDASLPSTDTPEGVRVAEFLKKAETLHASSKDTDLYRALEASALAVWPETTVTPYLFQAGTDAIAWRSRGVPVYGIYPYPITAEDLTRMHGNDERVPVESLEQGTEMIYKTLVRVASE